MSFVSSTYRKHLKFGYGPDLATTRSPTFFNIQIGAAENPGSFQSECTRAATLIKEQANGSRILIGMSGGLDSEVVARSFLLAQVPFEAVIFKYEDDANLHDIQSAIEFCTAHGIKTNFAEFNVVEFLSNRSYLDFCELYNCNSPLFAVHLELCKQFKDDFLVFAGSAPVLRLTPEAHMKFFTLSRFNKIKSTLEKFPLLEFPTENTFCFDHFFTKHRSKGVSSFFLYTPELVLSSLLLGDPLLQYYEVEHFSPKNPHKDFAMVNYFQNQRLMAFLKHRFFKRAGFDIAMREAKYTGFEKFHLKFHELQPEQSVYLKGIDGMTRFNKIYRAPMEERMPALTLGTFQIDKKDQEILFNYGMDNWASSNIEIF